MKLVEQLAQRADTKRATSALANVGGGKRF